jgi:outer membrane biosynthesis protein TonB
MVSRPLLAALAISTAMHALLCTGFPRRSARHDLPPRTVRIIEAPALDTEPPETTAPSLAASPRDSASSWAAPRVSIHPNPPPPGRTSKDQKVVTVQSVPMPDGTVAPARDVFAELSEGNPNAAVDALLYGEGTPGRDLSAPPSLGGSVFWDCPWPASADRAGVNHAAVMVTVDVTADGKPSSAHLVMDAGHDFGADAVACALQYRYRPGRDKLGRSIAGRTRPFPVLFNRREARNSSPALP